MGKQIVRQPDGKYAIFSSISDGLEVVDLTREEIIEELVSAERERITEKVNGICNALDTGGKPYFQFTMTWEEAKQTHEENHGPLED